MATPRPRDENGRFISTECPECGDHLNYEKDKFGEAWVCYGLIDPEDDSKPLAPCPYTYTNPVKNYF